TVSPPRNQKKGNLALAFSIKISPRWGDEPDQQSINMGSENSTKCTPHPDARPRTNHEQPLSPALPTNRPSPRPSPPVARGRIPRPVRGFKARKLAWEKSLPGPLPTPSSWGEGEAIAAPPRAASDLRWAILFRPIGAGNRILDEQVSSRLDRPVNL